MRIPVARYCLQKGVVTAGGYPLFSGLLTLLFRPLATRWACPLKHAGYFDDLPWPLAAWPHIVVVGRGRTCMTYYPAPASGRVRGAGVTNARNTYCLRKVGHLSVS